MVRYYIGYYVFKDDPMQNIHTIYLSGEDYWDVLFTWAGKLACKGINSNKVKRISLDPMPK